MRRANKILMAAVAILLCLVLITTSVVSGVFAKYAIKKQASTSVGLEKFGVGVTMTVDSSKLSSVGRATVTEVVDGDSITANISGLKIGPGDTLHDVVKFKFTGTPNVKMKFVFDFDISFTSSNFLVPNGTGKASAATYMFPIKLQQKLIQYGSTNTEVTTGTRTLVYPWTVSTNNAKFTSAEFENKALGWFLSPFYTYDATTNANVYSMALTDIDSSTSVVDNALVKEFSKNETFKFRDYNGGDVGEFRFGFEWPFQFSGNAYDIANDKYLTTAYDFNEIETYFANKSSVPTFDVSYTIKLEQVE